MKSTLIRASVFAAAALAFGTLGYAQSSDKVVADVNFNFRSVGTDLPAGQYSVTALRSNSSTLILKLTNEKSRHSVLLVSQYEIHGDRDEQPRLVFRCNSSACGLSEIWMGGAEGYKVPKPKLTPSEGERIAVVPLKVIHSNGD